jgi:hypothetical protein
MDMFKCTGGFSRVIFFGTLDVGGLILVGYHSSWWVALGLALTLWSRTIFSQDDVANRYLSKVDYDQYALPYIETLAHNVAVDVLNRHENQTL